MESKVATEVAASNSTAATVSKKRKHTGQEPCHRTWVFTVPNYIDTDIEHLKMLSGVKKLIAGKEVAPTTGMKHLQCAITWAYPKRFSQLKKQHPRWHNIEPAKSIDDAFNYCNKEDQIAVFIDNKAQGNRIDLIAIGHLIQSKRCWKEVISDEKIWPTLAKYPNFVQLMYSTKPAPIKWNPEHKLWKWQQQVVDLLLRPKAEEREVIWVCDRETANGKTSLCNYIREKLDLVQYFTNGKTADIALQLDNPHIVIFDITLDQQDRINYEIIEQAKNGLVSSGKYHSCLKIFTTPHVIVFANKLPDVKRLAENRFLVIDQFPRYD